MSGMSAARAEVGLTRLLDAACSGTARKALCWALLALAWFAPLGYRALLTPDEGRYATIALEMMRSGDWITPRLNGFLYFEKPALQYWMGAIAFHLFGVNDFAARLWPGLTGFLTVVAVAYTARRLWGQAAGAHAAMVAAGTTWIIANSHFLSLDMGLAFFLTLTLCAFVLAQRDGAGDDERRHAMWVTWAAMAGATLSKGLVGVLIPGATLVLYSLLNRQWAFWRRMHWGTGLPLFLALAAPWFVAVSLRNPDFFEFFFIHEHFQRYLTDEAQRLGAPWYFVPILLVGFLPWTTTLPALARLGARRDDSQAFQPLRLLLIWSAFVFVFFSVSRSKLPSYILPMFPALALLAAAWLERVDASRLARHLLLPVAGCLFMLAIAPFADRFATHDTPAEILRPMALMMALGAALFVAAAAVAWRALRRGRKNAATLIVAAASLVSVTLVMSGHDSHGSLKSSEEAVEALAPELRAGDPVFSVAMYDQTLPYYLRRDVTLVAYSGELAFGQRHDPQRWIPTLVQYDAHWRALPRGAAMMPRALFLQMQHAGLPMRVVYEDARRVVVVRA